MVDHHRRNPFPEVALAIKCVSRAKKVDFSSFSGFLAQNRVVGTLFPTPPPGIKCVSRAKNVNFCQFRAIFVIFGGFRREFSGFSRSTKSRQSVFPGFFGVFGGSKCNPRVVSRDFRGFWGAKMCRQSVFPGISQIFSQVFGVCKLAPERVSRGFGGFHLGFRHPKMLFPSVYTRSDASLIPAPQICNIVFLSVCTGVGPAGVKSGW